MSELFDAVGGGAIGIATGEAVATAIAPTLEAERQQAWKDSQARVLELNDLATLVAQALNSLEDVIDDAARNGYDTDQLRSAIQLALKAPGPPDAEKLYLRNNGHYPGAIPLAALHHAYAKAGLEGEWWDALTAAAGNVLLSPEVLALGAVRGTLNDQGLLVVELDTSDSNVQKYTPANLNIIDEAAAQGVSADRLRAMIGNVGLPMAVELAARATFRNILTKGGYYQAVLEGDTRPEWADKIFEVAREILTSHDWVEARVRNWIDDTAMYAGTALHGMSAADTKLLYDITGRPIPPHQVTTGLARGGNWPGSYANVPSPYRESIAESNVREEWAELDYANRYTYPSGFQIKAEAQAGTLSEADTVELLLEVGWSPKWAAFFAKSWAGKSTTSTNTHVKSAQTAVVSAAKKAFLATTLTPIDAATALEAAGLSESDTAAIIAQWQLIAKIEGTQIDTAGGTPT